MPLQEACLIILLTYVFILEGKKWISLIHFFFNLENINVLHYLLLCFAVQWKSTHLKTAVSP